MLNVDIVCAIIMLSDWCHRRHLSPLLSSVQQIADYFMFLRKGIPGFLILKAILRTLNQV